VEIKSGFNNGTPCLGFNKLFYETSTNKVNSEKLLGIHYPAYIIGETPGTISANEVHTIHHSSMQSHAGPRHGEVPPQGESKSATHHPRSAAPRHFANQDGTQGQTFKLGQSQPNRGRMVGPTLTKSKT